MLSCIVYLKFNFRIKNMKNISCGIDFGTTNTACALAINQETPKLIELEGNELTIPSAIFFAANKEIYYGRSAMKMYMNGQTGRCMRSLKRVLGSNLMTSGTLINNRKTSFNDIIGYFLSHIKDKIDTAAGEPVENAVIGRPVHFRDNDEDGDFRAENELRKIATNIGFKNIEFQYEPIAAAFAHEIKLAEEKLACVIDIGGGTSDFTIIKIGRSLIKKQSRKDDILGSTGIRIWGNDFDKNLSIKSFMPIFGYGTQQGGQSKYDKIIDLPTVPFRTMSEWSSINSMYNYKELNFAKKMLFNSLEKEKLRRFVELIEKEKGYSLLTAVEKTKMRLTDDDEVNVRLKFISDMPEVNVKRDDFEESMQWNIKNIFDKVDECLNQAQVQKEDIEFVILTGGSTEIPLIQRLVENYFPNAEMSQGNKLSSVGLGLAYDSSRRFNNVPDNHLQVINAIQKSKNNLCY